MPTPFAPDLLAGELIGRPGIDDGDLSGLNRLLQRVDFFQPVSLELRLELYGLDLRQGRIGGPLLLHPEFPAAVEDADLLDTQVLQRPPDTGGVGQAAAVD